MAKATCRALTLAAFAVLLLAAPSRPARADWNVFGGNPEHQFFTSEQITAPLAVLWKHASMNYTGESGNRTGAVIANGIAYFAAKSRVFAVDANSGELKWRVPESDAEEASAPTITATPAVSGDYLYVGDSSGNMTAYNTADGSQLWPPFRTGGAIHSSPIVIGDSLFFGSNDDFLYCLDARTGQLRWKSNERGKPMKLTDDAIGSPTYYSGVVYINSNDMKLWAFNSETGRFLWETRLTAPSANIAPVAFNGRIYLAAGASIFQFRPRTGGFRGYPLMQWVENDITTTPIITENAWYFGDRNGYFHAFKPNGKPLELSPGKPWKVKLEGKPEGSPVLTADTIYVATDRGFVQAIDVAKGEITWSYRMEAPRGIEPLRSYYAVRAPLAVTGGKLFIVSDDGTLTCMSANAPDDEGPTIVVPRPSRGAVINGNPPVYFSAYLWDEGTGINPGTIELMIDEVPVEMDPRPYDDRILAGGRKGWVYDPSRRRITYTMPEPEEGKPVEALREGVHKVTVQAADWRGNVTALEWTFTADRTVPKPTSVPRTQRNNRGGAGPGGMMPGGPGMSGGDDGGRGGNQRGTRGNQRGTRGNQRGGTRGNRGGGFPGGGNYPGGAGGGFPGY
jgi:outer membrane protein assembly factor BamB